MYIVSPFTPLFFRPSSDRSGSSSRYMQIFSSTDEILVEVIARSEVRRIIGKVKSYTGIEVLNLDWSIWSMNETDKLYYYTITGLVTGYYVVDINGMESEPFYVTSEVSELKDTVLIQYSMRDNKSRQDGVFWIAEQQKFFDFRVHGGFKDDNWSFGVNNEQFLSSSNELSEIYSQETLQKAFTLGSSIGCPVWFAEMLNRILSCTYVYFDGNRYIRYEGNTPEINLLIEGRKSYVFKQVLQEVKNIDYTESENQVKIRRVQNNNMRQVHLNKLLLV